MTEKIEQIKANLEKIKPYLNIGSGKVSLLDVKEEQWANEWKKYYKPVELGERIVIKPTWETYTGSEDKMIIEMDPGMAFGTGTHETTALCAELLENYIKGEETVLDIGTGSGILGIIAAKLGAKEVLGVDIDPVAVKVAKENVKGNQVEDIMTVKAGNLIEVVSEKADIVVSNIIADVIIHLSEQVADALKEDGIWIASGIINLREDDVIEAFKQNNWVIKAKVQQRDWIALVAQKGE